MLRGHVPNTSGIGFAECLSTASRQSESSRLPTRVVRKRLCLIQAAPAPPLYDGHSTEPANGHMDACRCLLKRGAVTVAVTAAAAARLLSLGTLPLRLQCACDLISTRFWRALPHATPVRGATTHPVRKGLSWSPTCTTTNYPGTAPQPCTAQQHYSPCFLQAPVEHTAQRQSGNNHQTITRCCVTASKGDSNRKFRVSITYSRLGPRRIIHG